MIIDAIVKILFGIVNGVLGLFPAWSVPESVGNFAGSLGASVAGMNTIVPVVTMGLCITALIATRLFVFAVNMAITVYQLIPFKAT